MKQLTWREVFNEIDRNKELDKPASVALLLGKYDGMLQTTDGSPIVDVAMGRQRLMVVANLNEDEQEVLAPLYLDLGENG